MIFGKKENKGACVPFPFPVPVPFPVLVPCGISDRDVRCGFAAAESNKASQPDEHPPSHTTLLKTAAHATAAGPHHSDPVPTRGHEALHVLRRRGARGRRLSGCGAGVSPPGKRAGRRRLPSFRWKCFFPGKLFGKKKGPSSPPLPEPPAAAEAKTKRGTMDMDDSGGGVFGAFTASSSSSSRLTSASSLYLYSYSYSSSPSTPARSSAVSCSLSLTASGALSPAPPPVRRHAKGSSSTTSPAAGAAAVVMCLLLVVLCGRVGATLFTPTALYLFPRRWPAKAHRDDNLDSRSSATRRRRRP
ncbi:uncharacterized protein [Miscanthus floridulus]|uniref:uncharacterized protein n=1 Tax=Miscanthus floridulus TaxID=154761 RepID=UPI00345A3734